MAQTDIVLTPGQLSLALCRRCIHQSFTLSLANSAYPAIEAAAATVRNVIARGQTVYGINTGFGLLANTRIAPAELATLQRSIVLSHAAGFGPPMAASTVRLMLLLKINSLGRGMSGVRAEVIDALLALFNHQVWPVIPAQGSVGASGDLAPLAHMSAVLLGEGEVWLDGTRQPASAGLRRANLQPLTLAPKEGLALLNGTQASTAFALEGLFAAERACASALAVGALSVDAARGSRVPFDPRIHAARGHASQSFCADIQHQLLGSSAIGQSHVSCEKVQDPYSLRCQPQVMGAVVEQIRHAATILHTEANGVSDNPLVFAEDDAILSGGNFHAQTVAMAADNLALALAETGALSERRVALLIDGSLSGLPPFLVNNGGVNSGFMLAQVTCAALASENKSLAHPASVDSLPTSANQEDHVSMAPYAGRRLQAMFQNVAGIVAIEWLAAAQGIDFLRPLATSPMLQPVHQLLRQHVSFYDKDRFFAPDIASATELVEQGGLHQLLMELLPPIKNLLNSDHTI